MQTRPSMVLRVFQWTLWILMLVVFAYAFLPGILARMSGEHDAAASPAAVDNTEQVSE